MKTMIACAALALCLWACGPEGAVVDPNAAASTSDDLRSGVGAGRACSASRPCQRGLSCEASGSGGQVCVPPAPLQLTTQGGPILPAMRVWTVAWQGDEAAAQSLNAFTVQVLASDYWSQVTAEYGVGPGTALGTIVLGAPPATLNGAQLDALVASLPGSTASDGSTVPPPDDQTVFQFLVPKSTREFGYYHSETSSRLVSASGALIHVPYTVIPQLPFPQVSDEDYLTWSVTHELAETATDPHCNTQIAWYGFAEEVGDLCNDIPTWTSMPDGSVRAVSRIWSAAAAAANEGDPCLPHLSQPYLNVVSRPAQVVLPASSRSTQITLVPFSYGAASTVHWQLMVSGAFKATPSQGDLAPGQVAQVTLQRVGTAERTTTQVWVSSPSAPNASIPIAESFGYVTP